MSRIDDLIAMHCPGGVPFKELREVAEFRRGSAMTIRSAVPGEYRLVANSPEPIGTHDERNRDGEFLVVARSGAGAGTVSWWEGPLFLTDAFSVHPDPKAVTTRYAYYLLQSQQSALREMKTGGGVPHVRVKEVESFRIPVPPLAVQREIATILDKMENLKAELEAELELRSRQYAFYRDSLFSFDETQGIKWATLSEVCTSVFSGGTPLATRPEYYGGDIPWLRTQEVNYAEVHDTAVKITELGLANSSAKWVRANSVIVAISGAGVTRGRAVVNKIPLTTNQHCCNLEVNEDQADHLYVYYWLVHHYEDLRSRGQGNRSDLNVGLIKSYPIAIPPLEEQRRIAATLAKFDAMVHNLSIGLPAEMNARQAQYEYYRDKLLTFEELVA